MQEKTDDFFKKQVKQRGHGQDCGVWHTCSATQLTEVERSNP